MNSGAVSTSLRTLTIILLAMTGGIVAITGVFLYLKSPGPMLPTDSGQQVLLAVLAGMALMESPVFFGVRAMKLNELRQRAAAHGVAGGAGRDSAAARRGRAANEALPNRAAMAPAVGGPGHRQAGPVDLHSEYATLTIIAAALTEGFALFGSVIYLLSGSLIALVAPALGVLVILAMLPNADRFDRFSREVTEGV